MIVRCDEGIADDTDRAVNEWCVQVGRRAEWSRRNLRASGTWRLAQLTFVSQSPLQVTFAAGFDEGRNVSEEGLALDDISMKEGACAAAGYCYCCLLTHSLTIVTAVNSSDMLCVS